MLGLEMPSVANRQTVTPEEYRRLKNDLYTARCDYAKLLHIISVKRESPLRTRRLQNFEQRIAALELELAHSDVVYSEEDSLVLSEISRRANVFMQSVKRAAAFWLMIIRNATFTK
jgi:hypothetical protein